MVLDTTAWAALAFQLAAYYLFPVVLWVAFARRIGAGWRWIGLGALTWLTALPAIVAVPVGLVAALGAGDPARMHLVWGAALSVTAGIVEESSRYLYYRRSASLRSVEGRRFALLAGAGHGGTEALVLGLQFAIGPILAITLAPDQLPPEFATSAAIAQFAVIGGAARILFVIGHIGFALLVWRAVARRRVGWYLSAVGLHITLDLLAFVVPDLIPGSDWVILVPTLALVAFALTQIRSELRRPTPAVARSSAPV